MCVLLTEVYVFAQVGFKPAGGIRTALESLQWLTLIKEELGNDWLCPLLFRLGASSLLADIERQVGTQHTQYFFHTLFFCLQVRFFFFHLFLFLQIYHRVTGQYAAYHELPMAWSCGLPVWNTNQNLRLTMQASSVLTQAEHWLIYSVNLAHVQCFDWRLEPMCVTQWKQVLLLCSSTLMCSYRLCTYGELLYCTVNKLCHSILLQT